MPRVPRLQLDGASYLVHSQGKATEPIFTNLVDYEAYLQLVAQYKQRHGFKLFAYCLMPNEAWLYLEPAPGTTLSAIMHDITTGYTRSVNKRTGRTGHLFHDRFQAIPVETCEALVATTVYLHLLPIRKGLAPNVEAYPFSSDPLYRLGDTVPDMLQMAPEIRQVLQALPGEPGPDSYAAYVERFSTEQTAALEQQMKHHLIGSASFAEAVQHQIGRVEHKASVCSGLRAQGAGSVVAVAPSPEPTAPSRMGFETGSRPMRPWVAVGTAAIAAFACVTLSLSQRIDGLTQMLFGLAQENEAIFRSRAAVTFQEGTMTGLTNLEGTAWDIRLAPLIGSGQASVIEDQLVFLNSRVSSTLSAAQGVVSTPYHLTTMTDGSVGWESMQADAKGQLITWQGSWQGTTMRGTITQQLPGQPPQQFTFVGVASTAGDAEPRSEL